MKVWLVVGDSESGDHYAGVFRAKPSPERLSALVHKWDGDEAHDGPGYDGSWVNITLSQHVVIDNEAD